MSERPHIGDDGELLQAFLHDVSEDNVGELARELAASNKETERRMLAVMDKLERENVSGLPRTYSTLGRGKDRLVVCNTPHIGMKLGEHGHSDINAKYLAFSRFGIFALEFNVENSALNDEKFLERYRKPLAPMVKDPGGNMFAITLFHNLLRSKHLDCVQHSFVKADDTNMLVPSVFYDNYKLGKRNLREFELYGEPRGPRPRSVSISTLEAKTMFDSVSQIMRDSYAAALNANESQLDLANDISTKEQEKPKRRLFGR